MGNDRDILIETITDMMPEELESDEADEAIVFCYTRGTRTRISHVGNRVQEARAVLSACETVLKEVGMKKEDALEALAVAWDAAKEEIGEAE